MWRLTIALAIAAIALIFIDRFATTDPSSATSNVNRGVAQSQVPQSDTLPVQRSAAGFEARRLRFRAAEYDCCIVDPRRQQISLAWLEAQGRPIGSIARLRSLLAEQHRHLLFATNAGIYTKESRPLGWFVADGKELVALNRDEGKGNFFLKPNGAFVLTPSQVKVLTSDEAAQLQDSVILATQSGPMLLHQGRIHPAFREGSPNTFVRSGVGIAPNGEVVFAISRSAVNFYDFALMFRERFNCRNALYLDGFVSRMYLPDLERMDLDGAFAGLLWIAAPPG